MPLNNSKPKKKSNWMTGFKIPSRLTDEEKLSKEQAARAKAIWDGNNGYRVPKQ